jgi:D-serine deaminase-like pyridoxal phosphate-dependent protein
MESLGFADWERLRRALADEPFPAAICEMGALEANAGRLFSAARAAKKTLRIATKSIRVPELLRRLLVLGGETARGLMTWSAAETLWLANEGFPDLLLAYPTVHPRDCTALAEANRKTRAAVAVDDLEHVEALSRAGRSAGLTIPLIIDVDASYRPFENPAVHLGVRRSPLRDPEGVVALAAKISETEGVSFLGLMSYEAQIAGLPDRGAGFLKNAAIQAIKLRSREQLINQRAAISNALKARGFIATVFNGGGTGSIDQASRDPQLTEVTAGSGFLASHLFDSFDGLALQPALSYALQATRRPAAGMITVAGGGFAASGEAGPSRLPIPWLPPGLELLPQEGAGEVQTPLRVPKGLSIPLGAPIFFRPAKAGEPLERFNELLLVRGDQIEARAKTYRGLGLAFG